MNIVAKYYLTIFIVALIGMGSSFFFDFDVQNHGSASLQADARSQAVEWRRPSSELKTTSPGDFVDPSNCYQEDRKNCDSTYASTEGE